MPGRETPSPPPTGIERSQTCALRPRIHFMTLSRSSLGATVALVAALLLTGCGDNAAPMSTFVLLDGSTHTTQDFKGKVTLVNFWATDCATCMDEMPQMTATYDLYKNKGYDMVAVAMQYDKPSYVVNYAQKNKLPFKVAIDNTGAIAKAWGQVQLTPTSFLLNKRGEIVKQYVGEPNFPQLHKLIEQLSAQS